MTSQPSRSPEVDKVIAALAKAQGAITAPERNKTVRVTPRSGGQAYSFKYATLSGIIEAIRKPFSENGLWFTQIISHEDGFYKVNTTLFHESGQFISSEVPIITEGHSNQQFGSALTYMKRYALSALIGIAAEEDDDGNIADGNEIQDAVPAGKKIVAPNPISVPKEVAEKITANFSPEQIPVGLLPDESASDWMHWGQAFIEMAKRSPDLEGLKLLERNNDMALKNMEVQVPKMFTNMMVALIKIKQGVGLDGKFKR